ncbi:phenylalanyl-tRNA synthetase beta subunit [Plasticicumulans lactativorans]|uniref:Phenylalanine--tRNA ligase beta subunit n=1 Tax=Plasticicumulans lactativorans TaxID=1133106 RepID=A0A4R2L7H3_9GAMM|nr:phenylalanine--tRNA ligase subunit beta [Plasticicumulans lactativorans]TCO83449.1 phenylalanyl-tRNA synthetase beta subunit [Plasticicumulans lactativorans]
MKISEQWLREWVNPEVSRPALVAQLSMAGLEVDAVTPVAPAFDGVVVAEVQTLERHPDADKLVVCRVDAGTGHLLQIVCGAPNVVAGMKVPCAMVGAVLPGDLRIRKSKLRGVESHGMLCSARELGLSEDHTGLLALPAAAPVGVAVRDYLGLDDHVIEVDLTPNRGDCLSVHGVAREVAALNRCALAAPPVAAVAATIADTFPVLVEAAADCPRYAGRVVRGVDAGAATPLWLQERLRRAGLRSLGPLVDVTNYVMLELGQPMHAFDLGRLEGGIVVRHSRAGETLELLNGSVLDLAAGELLIADGQGPLALAGIMGGVASGCTDTTRDVFLESAFFAPRPLAGRARRYGLHTDSSHRFERGVDPALQVPALERATQLLLDIAGGSAGPLTEITSAGELPQATVVTLRQARIQRLLGIDIPPAETADLLERLGMSVDSVADGWRVTPPSWRFDVAIEEDLIEEIGRVRGYDRLPLHRPLSRFAIAPIPETRITLDRLRAILVDRGYQEAITYSFVDPAFQAALDPATAPVALANPISAELAVMRTSLWPGLLKALDHNRKRQQGRVRLFESGLRFVQTDAALLQDRRIGGVACGTAEPEQWGVPARAVDFFDVKGDVEALLAASGCGDAVRFVAAAHPALHPGQGARIEWEGELIGWMGQLHPAVEKALDLDGPIYLFELALDAVTDARLPRFTELSRFPAIRRDLAILLAEDVAATAVVECIRTYGGEWLRDVQLFDVYRGKGIDRGLKSLALGLILQDFSRTLTDPDVDDVISRIVAGLSSRFGASLRA